MSGEPAARFALVRRLTAFLRDAWLIAGIALLLFLGLEAAYRGASAVRRVAVPAAPDPRTSPQHPYAGQPWWPEWLRQDVARGPYRFDPYRTWWRAPVSGTLAHVDSLGRRVTVQPPSPDAPRRVFLFGGSVMWGVTARDSFTIPSLVAAELTARGVADVEIQNYAAVGYNATQEVITLLLLLRDGLRPDVVVFLDGHNDVASAWRDGRAGTVLNQERTARRVERGTPGFWRLAVDLGLQSELVQRLALATTPARRPVQQATPPGLCDDVGSAYRNLVVTTEAVGREYGFTPLFLWQPVLDLTSKPLTPWERSIGSAPYRDLLIRCTSIVTTLLQGHAAFVPIHTVLDTVTAGVFLDNTAHVTEQGNALIAARVVDLIVPLVGRRR